MAIALCAIALLPAVDAAAQPIPQLRAFWVDTFNTRLNTPEDTAAVVARADAAHANTLFVQVRRRGDAWYVDAREPLPDGVAIEPGFDPLRDLVARGHAAGLAVHAFVVVGAVWSGQALPSSPVHVFNRHGFTPAGPAAGAANWLTRTRAPDGAATAADGFRFGSDFWIDLGHPDAAAYTVEVLLHLASQYDLDGLHLDRVRYPEFSQAGQSPATGASVGYNEVSLERFRRRHGLAADSVPGAADPAWSDWRREQVTAFVRRLYLEALAIKPHLVLSAAVVAFGDAPADEAAWTASEAYWRVFQDWRAWAEEGIVDLVVPMVYRAEHVASAAASLTGWADWARGHQYGRRAALGLGSYLNSVEGTLRQVRRALDPTTAALAGVALYSLGAHNAPVAGNPLAASRDTPYRAFEDVAAGLTSGVTAGGQALETAGTRPVFAERVPGPALPWKTAPDRGHVKGLVASGSGAVDGAEVTLELEGGEARYPASRTDGHGFFGRVGVPPGTYRVAVSPPGDGAYRSSCTLTVSAGTVAAIELRIDPAAPALAACATAPATATRRP